MLPNKALPPRLFNVMVNNQRDLSLVCPLGEYQKQGDLVQPHMPTRGCHPQGSMQ